MVDPLFEWERDSINPIEVSDSHKAVIQSFTQNKSLVEEYRVNRKKRRFGRWGVVLMVGTIIVSFGEGVPEGAFWVGILGMLFTSWYSVVKGEDALNTGISADYAVKHYLAQMLMAYESGSVDEFHSSYYKLRDIGYYGSHSSIYETIQDFFEVVQDSDNPRVAFEVGLPAVISNIAVLTTENLRFESTLKLALEDAREQAKEPEPEDVDNTPGLLIQFIQNGSRDFFGVIVGLAILFNILANEVSLGSAIGITIALPAATKILIELYHHGLSALSLSESSEE